MAGAPPRARRLAVMGAGVCAVLDTGKVACRGINTVGELGLGDTRSRPILPGSTRSTATVRLGGLGVIELAGGSAHVCALLEDHSVRCWGVGDKEHTPLGLTTPQNIGDDPGEMGTALQAVSLGTGRSARAIAASDSITCAILDNGSVKCWGLTPWDGRIRTAFGMMGDALPAIALPAGRTATALAIGNLHACAILDNGQVSCWGSNAKGQLGMGDTTPRGGDWPDAPGLVDLGRGRRAVAITAGFESTCVILDNGRVACWGANAKGELGLGDTQNRADGPGETGASLRTANLGTGRSAIGISAGWNSMCAVLDNGTMKCWGDNRFGILGGPAAGPRGDQPGEMGDRLPIVNLGSTVYPIAVDMSAFTACALLTDRHVKCWGALDVGVNVGESAGSMGDRLPNADFPSRVGRTGLIPR